MEQKKIKELLSDVDSLLAHLEDFTHGKDGDDITLMRKRIIEAKLDVAPKEGWVKVEEMEEFMKWAFINDWDRSKYSNVWIKPSSPRNEVKSFTELYNLFKASK